MDGANSRKSDAAATRKRRSSILKSQRCVRAPLSELEFHVATPDQAKSRRVSFSRRTGVAEFEINEATTAWKNVYEEHNKSLESSANESGFKAAPRLVAHLGARATHFEDAEADDVGADEPAPPPAAAARVAEMRADTDTLQLFHLDANPATQRELTDLNVNFSEMAPLALSDDLDALRSDLARAHKRDNISEISIDLNATNFSLKADDDDMSITDTIRSPAVATEKSQLDFSVAVKSQVDWTADKENIAVNPYIAPPPAEFACDDEDILVFDGKKCKFQSKLDLSDEPVLAGTSERVTLPVKENNMSMNKSVFLDDMTETHVIPAQILQNNSRVEPQRTVVFGSDGDMTTTQAVNTNIIDLKASNVLIQPDDKENQKTLYFNDMADMSVTQALPADIIEKETQRRKTIVYGADEGHISMTEAVPAGALVSAHRESLLGANKLDNTRRRTIVYDNADVSMTGVVGNIQEDKMGKINADHRTIVYGNDDGNVSVTGVVSANIIDEAKVTQPGIIRRTIVFGNDGGNVSLTGVLPAKIIDEEKVTAQPSTGRRRTIVYDINDGNVSMTKVLPAKIIDKALEIEQPKTDRRRTIVYGNDDRNVSITGVVPPNIIDESKRNPSVERRRTVVYENDEGNLSLTGVAPINILDAPKAFQETNKDRRKTVVFGNDAGNLSMTGVLPANIINDAKAAQQPMGRREPNVFKNNIDVSLTGVVLSNILDQNRSNVSQPPNTDRRNTVVYDNDDGDLSMTGAVPANIFGQNEANVPPNAEREITAVRENEVGNPLTAEASEVFEEQNEADKQPSKEHAIAVVSENIKRNVSMAEALLSNILDISNTNQPQDVERGETIVCGNNDANISMIGVLPAKEQTHKEANVSQLLNGERRRTIIYGNEDVSLTEIIPANVIQQRNAESRTIIDVNDHVDISMTGVLPTNILGEEHSGTNNTESADKDRRKTIVYNNDEGNVSITGIVPTNIVDHETNERRKTIVYEDNDVSMTGIVPAQIMAADTDVIVPETLTSVLFENPEQTQQKAEFNSEDNQVEMLDAVSKPLLIESDEDADVSMSQGPDRRQSLATNQCSSTFNKSLADQMGSTTFNKSLADQIVGSTTFNKSVAEQIGTTTFNKSLAEQIGSATFNKSLAEQIVSTTFNKSLTEQTGSTTFNKSLAKQIGSTTFNKSLAEQIGSTTFNKSLAERIGSTTFNKSSAEQMGSTTFNKSLADQVGSTSFNKSLAEQIGSTTFNKSLSEQIGSTTFNKSLADQVGSTTFNKSLAEQIGSTTFHKSLADQVGSTTFNKSLAEQIGSTTFHKSLADQMGSTTFNKSLADQMGSTTFNKSLADQVGSTTLNTSSAISATGQARSTTMNKSLTSHVLVYGVTTPKIQKTSGDTHAFKANNINLEENQSQNASDNACMIKCNSSADHSHQKRLRSEPVEQIPVVDRSSVLDALLDMTNASVEALQNEPPQVEAPLVKRASDVTVSVFASESYILVKDDDDEPVSKDTKDPEAPADGSEPMAIEYKKQHGLVCKLQRKLHELKDTLHLREKSPKREPKGTSYTNDKDNPKRSLDSSKATHDISSEKSPVLKGVLKTSSDVQEKNELVSTEDYGVPEQEDRAVQGDVTSRVEEKDQSQNTTEINAIKCQGDDTRAILDALSDFTDSRRSNDFEPLPSPEKTRTSAPDRKSMVISREDLFREISMAQALMKTEMEQTDVELDGTEGSFDEQEPDSPRLSGEVVKTLRFEDDDSILEPKVLQKPSAVEPSPRRTPNVIPSYDMSEPVKELMTDLIKPMVDGDQPVCAQSNSQSVQADNLQSSQIDLTPSQPVLIEPRPRMRTDQHANSEIQVSPRKPVVKEQVIVFDHLNPLNNVVVPPLDRGAAHAYDPRRSEETCAQTERARARHAQANSVLTAGRGGPAALHSEVNTSIAMKLNRELLAASSSLTLVDDTLGPAGPDERDSAPVHVLFKLDGPVTLPNSDADQRRRQKRPRAARGAEVTPKPATKVQKVSTNSKGSRKRRSASPAAREPGAPGTCGSVTTVVQMYACARSDTSDTSRCSRVSDWLPELVHEPSSKDLVCEHEPRADVAAQVAALPFMGTPECSWESRAGDTWSFRLLRARLRLLVRLEHRDNATRALVRADTPVRVALEQHAVRDQDRNDPIASLCLCLAEEALQRVCARGGSRAGSIPMLLRRCAAVARVALRWGRVLRAARAALAFSLADDGTLSLKVANIPLRSVWEVTLRVGLCADGRGSPHPRAAHVRVSGIVAAWAPGDAHVRALVDAVPDDWGHVPRTVW